MRSLFSGIQSAAPGRKLAVWGLVVLAFLLVAPAAFAQSNDSRVDQLEREIAALKAEMAQMKAEGGAAPAGGDARLTEIERRLEVLAGEIERLRIGEAATSATESNFGMGPAASKIYRTERGLSIGGYGEVLYQNFSNQDNGEDAEESDELDLLRAIVYFGYKFNDRWVFNSEVEYEHAGEEVEVEFAYLDYMWKPQANLRAGMVLLPMGFLNELHEPTVYLGARRPDTEQVILPTTWRENGFGLFGEAGPFSYRTYILAGLKAEGLTADSFRGARQEGIESTAEDFAWVGRLDYKGLPGLILGGSAYFGDSGQGLRSVDGRSLSLATRIYEGHVEWRWRGLEVRGLAVQTTLDDIAALNEVLGLTGADSIGEKMTGRYIQAGYDVLAGRGGEKAFIPFARWETYNTQDEVPAGFLSNPANDVESLTVGFSFKPIEQIVIKVDHQDYKNEAKTGVDQFNVALGYVF